MRHRLAVFGAGLLLLPACQYTPSALEDWRDDPSRGRYENRNEPVSAEQERANRCLLEAFATGRPAELVVTFHSVEGDPVTTYYRILGPHRVEVFVDNTADRYSDQKWVHMLCGDLVDDPLCVSVDFAGCRELGLDEVVTTGYG